MFPEEIEQLQTLVGGPEAGGGGGRLGALGGVFGQILGGQRFSPGYESGLFKWANTAANQLRDWSGRQEGAYPALAQAGLGVLKDPLAKLSQHEFERKYATPREMQAFDPGKLAFDPTKGQMSDGLKKEIEARDKLVGAMKEEYSNKQKLNEQDKRYLAQTSLASPQAMESLGKVRGGVEAAKAWAETGENLRPEDVKAIVAGRKHISSQTCGNNPKACTGCLVPKD